MQRDQIDELILASIKDKIFPGAVVLIGSKDKIEFLRSYGTADGAKNMSDDFLFDIASVTKCFTATAILKLIDEQKLSLDTKLHELVPEFGRLDFLSPLSVASFLIGKINGAGVDDITIRQLLNNTSGISNLTRVATTIAYITRPRSEGLIREFLSYYPLHKSGGKALYNNMNATLLGLVIERITKKSLALAMNDLIFEPLDISQMMFNPPVSLKNKIIPTGQRIGRGLIWGEVNDESAFLLGGISGHAGLFSSASDLWKLGVVWTGEGRYKNKQFIKPNLIKEAFLEEAKEDNYVYCLGWGVNNPGFIQNKKFKIYGRVGFTGPSLVICPELKKVIVFLCNRTFFSRANSEAMNKVRSKLTDLVIDAKQ